MVKRCVHCTRYNVFYVNMEAVRMLPRFGQNVKLLSNLPRKTFESWAKLSTSATNLAAEELNSDKLFTEEHKQLQNTVVQVNGPLTC